MFSRIFLVSVLECFLFLFLYWISSKSLREREKMIFFSEWHNHSGFLALVNFALISLLFDFSTQNFILWPLSRFSSYFLLFNMTSSLAPLFIFSVLSSQSHLLFNVSPHAKKNIIGSQKQHFHLPSLFSVFFYYFTSRNFSLLLLPNLRDCMNVLVSENLCMMRKNFFTFSFFSDSFQQWKLHLNCDQELLFDILLWSMPTQNYLSPQNKTGNHNLEF